MNLINTKAFGSLLRTHEPSHQFPPAAPFAKMPALRSIRRQQQLAKLWGVKNPFFALQQRRSGRTVTIDGRDLVNFAWCDYLGLSDHPDVIAATKAALDSFGACVSASRMVSGELAMHREFESDLADFCGMEKALLFVSGHAANVSTIGSLMGPDDLIVHDEFVHNSAIVGARLSGARLKSFRHNNAGALQAILERHRNEHENVLIVVEGLYSTEGDIPDLAGIVEIKKRFGCWLMVDDAHGLGVLGKTGRGIAEHCGVEPRDIDILMGTLSKTLGSCGGYIAGDADLIEILKYSAPGFVFSVSLTPPMTAAAAAALRIIREEPARIARLQENSCLFAERCRDSGLNTGRAIGLGVIPVVTGSSRKTADACERLMRDGFNASPIIYPGVPINAGRLRFFVTSEHTPDELDSAVAALAR